MRTSRWLQIFALLVMTIAFVSLTQADTVTYSTAGSFNGGGSSITFGGGGNTLTILFNGASPTTVNDSPFTFASLGQFVTSATGAGASITAGTTFSLSITQTAPTSGNASLFGTLSGTISQNQSTGMVTFSVSQVTIGNEQYSLTNNPVVLVPPSSNGGQTTVQARIEVVPEPASIVLFGIGTAVCFAAARRRKA